MFSGQTQNRRMIFLILYLTYICVGIISILPGPTLPLLASNTGVPIEVAGWIFTTSATGFMVGVLIAGIVSQRFGPKYVLMSGLAIMSCAGIVTPMTREFSLLLGVQFVQGIGFGFLDVTISMIVALTFGEALSETLNNLHSAFGVGALVAPLLLSLALQLTHQALLAYLSGAIVGMAGIFFLIPQSIPSADTVTSVTQQHKMERQNSQIAFNSVFRQPLLWLLAIQIALYVGAEVSFGNWIVTAVSMSAAISLALAAPCATLLWAGLTTGRLVGAQILKRGIVGEHTLLYISVIGSSLCGLLVAVFPGNIAISFSASALVGFFFGPIFPGIMAIAARYFVKVLGTVSGVMLISAGGTAMILPLLMGILIPHIGIHWVMAIPALVCLSVIIPLSFALRQQRQSLLMRHEVHTVESDLPLPIMK
jgi:fucose permease